MKGKNREVLRKETPLPLLQMELLRVSVMGLPAPWPVILGGGVSLGLRVTLSHLGLWS